MSDSFISYMAVATVFGGGMIFLLGMLYFYIKDNRKLNEEERSAKSLRR